MRGKGKQTIVWLLMGMLVLGLGGFGVTNFSGGTADVGAVGDVEISSQDYARALRTEIQGFAAQTGRQLTPAEAKSIGLDQAALSRLYVAAALEDEANRIGVSVGDKAVADQITAIPAFKGLDGRFDRARYADALKREGLREAEFEHDLRMDEARQILQGATLAAVAGMVTMLVAWRQGRVAPSWSFHLGLVLAGWGLFNLVEGLVDHQILGVHHVRDDLGGPLSWDIGFLLSGVLLIAVGWWVHRRGVRDMARRAARGGQSGGRAGGRVIR